MLILFPAVFCFGYTCTVKSFVFCCCRPTKFRSNWNWLECCTSAD